jgi:succinate dehydrogenase / fumarate reductase cytochrome b subunit
MSISALFKSSLAKKYWMALTGLFLCSFLLIHLIGNLQLLADDGGIAFNEYAKFMTSFPPIVIVSYLLYASILLHAVVALALTLKNRKARPIKYASDKPSASSGISSRMMGILGSLVLIFIITHMAMYWGSMKFGGLNMQLIEEGEIVQTITNADWSQLGEYDQSLYVKSLYEVVITSYTTGMWGLPGIAWVIFYVLAQFMLGFHLWHGFSSAFQSLGLRHSRYTQIISWAGKGFAAAMIIGFSWIPIQIFICFSSLSQ